MAREGVERNTDGGFDAVTLAGTGYNAFRHACQAKGPNGQALPHWDQLPERSQAAWVQAVSGLATFFENAGEQGLTVAFSELARMVYAEHFLRGFGHGAAALAAWESLPLVQRWAWDAAVRHLSQCLQMDADDRHDADMERLEMQWRPWVAHRCPLTPEAFNGQAEVAGAAG